MVPPFPARLKRRPEFLRVAGSGRKWVAPGLILQALDHATDACRDAAAPPIRVGFTASRKVGGAVMRNRARRRLRAAVNRVMPVSAKAGHDFVVIARSATLRRPFGALVADLETALKRLGAYCENGPGEAERE